MRPIGHAAHQTVFHRIDVAILDVPSLIRVVSDQVFPKSPLPNTAFAARASHRAQALHFGNGAGEPDFDPAPSDRIVRVAGRQCPDGMQVVRQNDERVDMEEIALLRFSDRFAECVDFVD